MNRSRFDLAGPMHVVPVRIGVYSTLTACQGINPATGRPMPLLLCPVYRSRDVALDAAIQWSRAAQSALRRRS